MASYDPWFDTDAEFDWMALPQDTRPTLEEFKAQRRQRRALGLTPPLIGTASTPLKWTPRARPLFTETTPPVFKPTTPPAVLQPDFVSSFNRARLKQGTTTG